MSKMHPNGLFTDDNARLCNQFYTEIDEHLSVKVLSHKLSTLSMVEVCGSVAFITETSACMLQQYLYIINVSATSLHG